MMVEEEKVVEEKTAHEYTETRDDGTACLESAVTRVLANGGKMMLRSIKAHSPWRRHIFGFGVSGHHID